MKAWVLHGVNDIRFEEIQKPVPDAGEALVRVRAAGICGSDVPRVFDTGAHRHPLIIGHEFSGMVEEVGSGASEDWLGKPVGIFPLIPCKKCEACLQKKYEMCESYDYVGSRRDGAFAQYVTVPEWNLIELPSEVSFREAAMLEPMAVAVHAIRRGTGEFSLSKDAKIAVCGLGTIGLLTISFLQDAGYENLVGIGKRKAQLERAARFGLSGERLILSEDIGSDSKERSFIRDEADLFFECVGKQETLALGISSLRPGGRLMLVGNPASDMKLDRSVYWQILRRQLTVYGTWNSSFIKEESDDWHYVLARLSQGRIRPDELISHTLKIENLYEGLLLMRDKKEEYCKVMVADL